MATNDIARVYATSLVEIGQEKNILQDLEDELKSVVELLKEKDVDRFFRSPSFSKIAKKEFLKKVFSGRLSEHMLNFLHVIIENDRITVIDDICQAVEDLIDIVNNVMRVTVTSNRKLETSQVDIIRDTLSEQFGKKIVITEDVDESILGGIIIKAGDLVMDGSLQKDLKNIRTNLLNSKVRSEVAYED